MKELTREVHNRLDQTKGKISELEDKTLEISESEEKKFKKE